ncbi:hypothetical protein SLEP1_g24644 [Rubroshorea leprosula]|uniref:Uncharacterized protein n=1 Tax=Rubroshorea leprosula TaxID=152421 RepID=A0AAV5JQU9_9ROSI|nr:hypothetical protein SLEP1_g24644 [Rubroshorea leprosula]
MCNHEKRIQYGNELDVSSIGHGQRLTPTGRRTVCWCIIPTSRVTQRTGSINNMSTCASVYNLPH